jgi:O-antigen/teichoic acid export membrane protein
LSLVNLAFVFIVPGKDAITSSEETQRVIYLYFFVFLLSGIILFISFIITNKKEGAIGLPDKEMALRFLRYSLTALAANVIFFLVYRIDYLFVKTSPVCTDADLGNYIQVSKLGQMMLIVPQIIASVVFPQTASGIERQRLSNSIMVMARLFSQLFLGVFIVVILTGHYFFIYVFGASFNKMQLPMLIIIPGIFSLSVLALLSAYFSGVGKLKVNVQGTIFALVVMVLGDFLFVPRFGIVAAALVSTVSYIINLGYSLLVFNKDHDIHIVDFFRWRKQDYYWIRALVVRR